VRLATITQLAPDVMGRENACIIAAVSATVGSISTTAADEACFHAVSGSATGRARSSGCSVAGIEVRVPIEGRFMS
jgi:hypothetical protein